MQDVKESGKLEKPTAMTATQTYSKMRAGSASGSAEAPMHTNGGKHPGTPRLSKHPMKSLTSRKGQQSNGGC